MYPYLRQIVFDLALSLTYGPRQKDADDEFVLILVKNINKISYVAHEQIPTSGIWKNDMLTASQIS
jgi:hypothetical protein